MGCQRPGRCRDDFICCRDKHQQISQNPVKTYPIFSSRLFSLDVSFSIIYRVVSEFVQDEDFKRDTCSFVVLILVPYKQQVQSATKTQSKVSKGSTRGC